MNRAQKVEAVEALQNTFTESETVVLGHNNGLTVAQMTEFRAKMREAGGSVKVVKNRLAQRAAQGGKFEGLNDMFKGPVVMASSADPIAAAKVTYEFAKSNEKLVILGGGFGDKALDKAGVESLAKLPSLDEIRSKVVAMISTPATRIATLTQAPATQIARVLKAYAEKG
ncbi:MAG: 50S ribosomal protein L10 [Pseudomonadota bacterium]